MTRNMAWVAAALAMIPPAGVVANTGEYPLIDPPIDPDEPEPGDRTGEDRTANLPHNPRWKMVVEETDACPPPDPIFPTALTDATPPNRKARRGSYHRPGFDVATFYNEVERRRKKNKAARKARKKNRR
jgi:hypothetical protein